MPEPTCSPCRLWHRLPTDPMNLGAPPLGQCRARPHAVAMTTPQGGAVGPAFYLATPAEFPACVDYRAADPVPAGNGRISTTP